MGDFGECPSCGKRTLIQYEKDYTHGNHRDSSKLKGETYHEIYVKCAACNYERTVVSYKI